MFNKPKFWDLKKPNFLSYLLLPFTIPIIISNFIYKLKSKRKYKEVKTICLGNIYVGGTGKTPTVIKLYEILKNQFKTVTAKKLYSNQKDEQTILKNKTKLITSNDRSKIIKEAIKNEIEVIIFDDGLQDKKIDYNIKFVCFDAKSWVGNGHLMPSGPLREKLSSLKKYDALFLRNEDSGDEKILNLIKKYNHSMKIFYTNYEIMNLRNFQLSDKYLIFSGIGIPQNFKDLLSKKDISIVEELIFPDHYNYTKNDIDKIKSKAAKLKAKIITTEKDYVKIPSELNHNINFLEVNVVIKNEKELINYILKKINE